VSFDDVRCLVSPQPVTTRLIVEHRLAVMGLGDRLDDFNTLVRLRTSVGLEQRIPQRWARSAPVPTFLYQGGGDILTDPSNVQAMTGNIPVAEKKLQWIEGTTARWDGYLEFQRRPHPKLDWFAQYSPCPPRRGDGAAVPAAEGPANDRDNGSGTFCRSPASSSLLAPSCSQAPAHTGDMRRIIGTILGAILAISLAFTAVGRIVATLKTFLIIGLIAMAVIIIVWLVARRPRRG
jgi:hypothetical protein